MISPHEADRLRDQLLAVLDEDAHNTERLLERLRSITDESGIGAHAALLLILTQLAFEEQVARVHWEAILAHRDELTRGLGRDAGVRVAIMDYFMNVNRRLVQPTLIDLQMFESGELNGATDRTTGLATDRKFRSALQREIRRARRYRQHAAVVLVDVDEFRKVNARFGPLVADRLLREAAIVLNNNVRDIDVAARPGEDEMALLLPETGRNGALLVAERFRQEVEAFFATRESAGVPVRLTVSAGVACYPDDATTPETLLERAAQALYQAKASGRNAVLLYHPERRRYLRFELDPERFEIEVLNPEEAAPASLRNLSRNGILFACPEPFSIGEEIEIRLIESQPKGPGQRSRCVRGQVVRVEELPVDEEATDGDSTPDRFEIGVALDLDWATGTDDFLALLERAQADESGLPL